MKNQLEKPMSFGFIALMNKGETTLIPWSKRASAYNAAKRYERRITVRKVENHAKIICLDPCWENGEEE